MKPIIAYLGFGKRKCNTSVGKYIYMMRCIFGAEIENPHDVPQPLECGTLVDE